ncbi:Regulator of nonsense transcripts 2 [Sarcoptes scabiei]|uniref:Regulator of nonsense transcripts 2 n=1 Tax=Sarcoptes scabiei TaxID=52283 RepID=A0A132A9F6_SARSC|nr:Regulator of nonsense transcripts 2 [Sarcoptes scabiei]KPM07080.1 regulator of nonsense transcripts 2-like protein [Sarcoptes scabiei]
MSDEKDLKACESTSLNNHVLEEDKAVEGPEVDEDKKELQTIQLYIEELKDRFETKRYKRYLHNVENINYPTESFMSELDSSIKKNTAFVKKIRNLAEPNKDALMKDLENLNLSRYISELAQGIVETKIKLNEVPLLLQICSFLHLRYQEFSAQLMKYWSQNLPKKPSDQFNASKIRTDVKLFSELILYGILPAKESLTTIGNLLIVLTNGDKETFKNLNILIAFFRNHGVEFSGIVPRKMRLLAEKFSLSLPSCDFLQPERQKAVQNLIKDYHQSLVKYIVKERKQLYRMKNDMKRNLETRGEISNSLQEKWKQKNSDFEKLFNLAAQFSDLIDQDMPDIDSDDLANDSMLIKTENVTAVLFDVSRFKENNSTLWDDEETRTFYENIPDLKSLVPAMLYNDSLKEEPSPNVSDQSINEESKLENISELKEPINIDEISILNDQDELDLIETKDDKMKIKTVKGNQSATKDQLDTFFSSLPYCVNRDMIDKAALQFTTTFNTKNNRKKLVNVLVTVPRTRLDLLPFYSRFVAQLAPIMPQVANDLCSQLKNQFRYNFFKKDQVNIESKVKIVRFIGELIKFKIFSKTDVVRIFKTLLSDFHHHHIEMTCNLFETCGQYLYRSPDSHHMTNLLLQQMMRLKSHMHVNTRYEIMIQNAFYLVVPDDKTSSKVALPAAHRYVEYLIFVHLNRSTISFVLNKLRKMNWTDKDTCLFIVKSLSSPWNLKFDNIKSLAQLLTNIYQHQSRSVLMVLDNILEEIRLGMQMNSLESNQRRIAIAKYFAECYNYNLIDSNLLFNTLYSLITYGVNYNEIEQSFADPPLNMMRFRLVSQILSTCGHFLLTSSLRKKLEYFLYFFQRYYWLKKNYLNTLPQNEIDPNVLAIDTLFKDTINNLRINFRLADSSESSKKQLEAKLNNLTANAKEILPNVTISVKNILDGTNNKIDDRLGTSNNCQNEILTSISEDPEEEQDEGEIFQTQGSAINLNDGNKTLDSECSDNDDVALANYNSDEEINNTNENFENTSMKDSNDSDEDSVRIQGPILHRCEDDDDFQREYERLMNENLTSRSQTAVRSNVEIVIPITRDSDKSSNNQLMDVFAFTQNDGNVAVNGHKDDCRPKNFNFQLMTKNLKSSKPMLKLIEIPSDSDLVQNFLTQAKAKQEEKERVKKLILNMNERREMEDNNGNFNSFRSNDSQNNSTSRPMMAKNTGFHNNYRSNNFNRRRYY